MGGGSNLFPSNLDFGCFTTAQASTSRTIDNDWSRNTRKQLSILKVGFDLSHHKLTSYFSFVKDIEKLVAENPTLAKCIDQTDIRKAAPKGTFTPLFHSLMESAHLPIQRSLSSVLAPLNTL